MKQAYLEELREVHGAKWPLYRLSNPVMGYRFDKKGRVEPHPIYFVLGVPNGAGASLLESNERGELMAFGRLHGSVVSEGSVKASLAALGYAVAEEERAAS